MEFSKLPIQAEIPTGYRLATCKEVNENRSNIQPLLTEGEVRLKDGFIQENGEVIRRYQQKLQWKLVRLTSSSSESHVLAGPTDKEETPTPQSGVANDTTTILVDDNALLVSLTYACEHDDVTEVEDVMKHYKVKGGPGIFKERLRDRFKSTVLHVCARYGSVKTLAMLLQSPEITQFQVSQTNCGFTPLHEAAFRGQFEATQLLLDTPFAMDMLVFTTNMLSYHLYHLFMTKRRSGDTVLHSAVRGSSVDVVKAILTHPKAKDLHLVDQVNNQDQTPLHLAAQTGQKEICSILLENGASIESKDIFRDTVLHSAVRGSSVEAVKAILTHPKAKDLHLVDQVNNQDQTPLHLAAEMGQKEICSILLENGASIESKDKSRDTVLHSAVRGSSVEAVKAILTHPKAKDLHLVDQVNNQDQTPLHLAAQTGQKEICSILLENGASIESKDIFRDTVLHRAVRGSSVDVVKAILTHPKAKDLHLVDQVNNQDQTPLHLAAQRGQKEICSILLENGASIESKDIFRDTVLHSAVRGSSVEAVKAILTHPKAKDLHLVDQVNNQDQTPLHLAAEMGQKEICSILLENGASIESKDKSRDTVLHSAVRGSSVEAVKAILTHPKAKDLHLVDQVNNEDQTPLHLAAEMGQKEICSILLGNGASIQSKDKSGKIPLQHALDNDDVALTFLQSYKVDSLHVNHKFKHNRTLLHVAANYQEIGIINDLMKKGAFVDATNDDGETPLHIATIAGHYNNIHEILSNEGIKFEHTNDKKKWVNMGDSSGDTALHNAAKAEVNLGIVDLLLENDACVDLRNSDGETPLHLAVQKGDLELVDKLLLKENIMPKRFISLRTTWEMYVSMCDFSGETPLHVAVKEGHHDLMKKLLKHLQQDHLVIRDIQNRTALYWAVRKDDSIMMDKLLELAGNKNKAFLLWNLMTVHGDQIDEWPLKEHVTELYEKIHDENLLEIAARDKDLDMALELINKGDFDVTSLEKEEWRNWLSENLCKKPSDQPALEDSLGRRSLANAIAALLLNPFTGTPLTIGIFGIWGMGKSSLMLQVEEALLRMAVNEAFKKPRSNQYFKGSNKGTQSMLRFSERGEALRKQVVSAFEKKNPKTNNQKNQDMQNVNEGDDGRDLIGEILPTQYQSKNREMIKNLALTNRSNLVTTSKEKGKPNSKTSTRSLEKEQATGQIPAILTVRYNAWQYKEKTEASAGLAIEIIKEIEHSMTPPQWMRMCWKYSWECQPKEIFLQILLPLFLTIAAVCIMVILWKVVPIKTSYKALALPLSLFGVYRVWFRNLMNVTKPIATTILNNIKSPDHTSRLGYQQQVIQDINFLTDQLCEEAHGWWWRIVGFLGSLFIPTSYYMKDTRVPKQVPVRNNFRIVVFIDDLDRCDESTILELLSTINLILGACGINVVVGIDKGMVENAIGKSFLTNSNSSTINLILGACGNNVVDGIDKGMLENAIAKSFFTYSNNPSDNCRELAEKYIRKIIQLPIPLPEPSINDLQFFIKGQIGKSSINNDVNPNRDKEGASSDKCDQASKDTPEASHSTLHSKQQEEDNSRVKKFHPHAVASRCKDAFHLIFEQIQKRFKKSSTQNDGKPDHHKEVAGKEEVNIEISVESTRTYNSALEDKQQENQAGEHDISEGCAIRNNDVEKLDPDSTSLRTKGDSNHHKEAKGNNEHDNTIKKYKIQDTSLENKQQEKQAAKPGRSKESAASSSEQAFHLLLATYSPLEVEMLEKLSERTTGDFKSPREWKRFLNYHRLAWNILSQDPKMEKQSYKGWQRKLILWIFLCWNWSEQMDVIIKNWNNLLFKKSTQAKEVMKSAKDRTEMHKDMLSLGDVIDLYMKGMYPEWKPYQEISPESTGNKSSSNHLDANMQRKMSDLYVTLKEDYDLRMEFIQVFQQFRFYSKLDHLEINDNMVKKSTKKKRASSKT